MGSIAESPFIRQVFEEFGPRAETERCSAVERVRLRLHARKSCPGSPAGRLPSRQAHGIHPPPQPSAGHRPPPGAGRRHVLAATPPFGPPADPSDRHPGSPGPAVTPGRASWPTISVPWAQRREGRWLPTRCPPNREPTSGRHDGVFRQGSLAEARLTYQNDDSPDAMPPPATIAPRSSVPQQLAQQRRLIHHPNIVAGWAFAECSATGKARLASATVRPTLSTGGGLRGDSPRYPGRRSQEVPRCRYVAGGRGLRRLETGVLLARPDDFVWYQAWCEHNVR
jgi:hypothetical protein